MSNSEILEQNNQKLAELTETLSQKALSQVPEGGTTGQVLAKASDTNYDTTWIDAPSGDEKSYRHNLYIATNDFLIYCEIINKSQEIFTLNALVSLLSPARSKKILCNGYGRNNAIQELPYALDTNGARVELLTKKLIFTIENSEVIVSAESISHSLSSVNSLIDTVSEV